jgi:hypothetical protein
MNYNSRADEIGGFQKNTQGGMRKKQENTEAQKKSLLKSPKRARHTKHDYTA